MKSPVFSGCATALVTPYDEQGIDYALAEKLIERQAEGRVEALAVCATTGEAPVLSQSERAEWTAFCVRGAAGRMKIIVGVGGNDTQSAARAARQRRSPAMIRYRPLLVATTISGCRTP